MPDPCPRSRILSPCWKAPLGASVQIEQHVCRPHVAVLLARFNDTGPRNADAIDPSLRDGLDVLVRADPIDVIDGEAHFSKQLAHGVRNRRHAPSEELLYVTAPTGIDVEARPDFARAARAGMTGAARLDPAVAPVLSPGRQVGRDHARALVHRPQGHGGCAVTQTANTAGSASSMAPCSWQEATTTIREN